MADPADMMAAYTAGTLTRPTAFVHSLTNHPRDTLRRHPLNMADDGSLGASGVTARCFVDNHGAGQRPGSVLRTLRMHGRGIPDGHDEHRDAARAPDFGVSRGDGAVQPGAELVPAAGRRWP